MLQKMIGPRFAAFFACYSAFVLAGSADYHAIEGAHTTSTGHGLSGQCLVIPSTKDDRDEPAQIPLVLMSTSCISTTTSHILTYLKTEDIFHVARTG
jgi:hypothetical protein